MQTAPPEGVPGNMELQEANEVLAILDTYNFAGCFNSWVVSESADKVNIVVNTGNKMQLHIDLLCAIARLFPVRCRGPFLGADTLTLEFTTKNSTEQNVIHNKKRARIETQLEAPTLKCTKDSLAAAGSTVDSLLSMLRTSLSLYNSSGCTIKKGDSGQDEDGPWCTFELCFTDRVNLLFCVHAFAMTEANTIKDLWVIQHPKPHILIRPFTKNDRRIISSWEIVPMLPRNGQFTMLRHKRFVS
jgi:hypothetical protein